MKHELPNEIISDGIHYTLHGDYYFPDIHDNFSMIGRWGQMHLKYIQECHHELYCELLFADKLRGYLETIDRQAQERVALIVQQMKKSEGVTEELKANDQMEWVQRMNSIRARAEEIVIAELIHN